MNPKHTTLTKRAAAGWHTADGTFLHLVRFMPISDRPAPTENASVAYDPDNLNWLTDALPDPKPEPPSKDDEVLDLARRQIVALESIASSLSAMQRRDEMRRL